MKPTYLIISLSVAVAGGFFLGKINTAEKHDHKATMATETSADEAPTTWTCSMHPQVQMPEKGLCPICAMDLIPAGEDDGDSSVPSVTLSEKAKKLAELETSEVKQDFLEKQIDFYAKLEINEAAQTLITARFPGRIERLYVDTTGIRVKKGEHLAELYSPELIAAQEELLQSANISLGDKRWSDYAGKKLRLWGLTNEQVLNILISGKAATEMTLYAPSNGTVLKKLAVVGKYVKTGEPIYEIADLSTLWLQLDAFETDLPWIQYGQTVEFETEAFSQQIFTGQVVFIAPIINEKTRTVKIRVNVDNSEGLLKPGMFVRARLTSQLGEKGKVVGIDRSGLWICSMHPEEVKNDAGNCSICEMPLEEAEKVLPKVSTETEAPLLIPVIAPLITGKRAIVYVEVEDGKYEGKVVKLGARNKNFYIVHEGLKLGDKVVTNGNFKVDSAIQLLAKPSMMTMDGEDKLAETAPKMEIPSQPFAIESSLIDGIKPIFQAYFSMQQMLSKDKFEDVSKEADKVLETISNLGNSFSGEKKRHWEFRIKEMATINNKLKMAKGLENTRIVYAEFSKAIDAFIRTFGKPQGLTIRKFHCSMAFDNQGGDWFQDHGGVENPYYGSMMYRCGEEITSEQ